MLDSPLTETLIRLTINIDLPQNHAILCMGLPDRTKNERNKTNNPRTSVEKMTQMAIYRVRIISSLPRGADQFHQKSVQVAISSFSKMASTTSMIQIRCSKEAYPMQSHLIRFFVRTSISMDRRSSSSCIAK
jgi:hypothetical protein